MKNRFKTYDEWRALGPKLAAKYLSDYNNHNPEKRRKIALIIQEFWDSPDYTILFGKNTYGKE